MSAKNLLLILLTGLMAQNLPSSSAAVEEKKVDAPMPMQEISSRREALREKIMLPSLHGIKSLSYRVVGFKDFEPLENVMAAKLALLDIKKTALVKSKDGKTPLDAMLQITFSKLGKHTVAELKLTQWVNLVRDPKLCVRAVTYSDKLYLEREKPEEAVERLSNQFVIDFLKANQKDFNAYQTSLSPDKAVSSKAGKK